MAQPPLLSQEGSSSHINSHQLARISLLPADRLAFDLLIEPGIERLEIIQDGRGIHLFRAGNGFESVRPGARFSHRKHGVQFFTRIRALVNRASMNRESASSRLRKRSMELKLKN